MTSQGSVKGLQKKKSLMKFRYVTFWVNFSQKCWNVVSKSVMTATFAGKRWSDIEEKGNGDR